MEYLLRPNGEFWAPWVDFEECINGLSCGSEQWAHTEVHEPFGGQLPDLHSYYLVAYSNPDPHGMPNVLCFALPTIRVFLRSGEQMSCVRLSSDALLLLTRGLYWLNDVLCHDELEDFDRVWRRLKSWFASAYERPDLDPGNKCHRPTNVSGDFYSQEIRAHLLYYSQNREVLEQRILDDEPDWTDIVF